MYKVLDKDMIEKEILAYIPSTSRGFSPTIPSYEMGNAILYLTDRQGLPMAMLEPVAGNHNNLYRIAVQFEVLTATPQDAAIPVKGLFLNGDAGLDSKYFRRSCDKKDINANLCFNKRNGTAERNEYFDQERYDERYAVKRTNVWMDSYRSLRKRFKTTNENRKGFNYLAFIVTALKKIKIKRFKPLQIIPIKIALNFWFLFFALQIAFICKGQEVPTVKNFYPTDYKGENQNWAISQSSKKLIYVANGKSLLEFNGAYWNRYMSPNESIMRSVMVIDDLIYTGCFMEFGFWQKNEHQILEYTSISKQTDVELIEDEEFWNIVKVDDWILFQSFNRIYIYNVIDKSVILIGSEYKITHIFEINEEIYFQALGEGIFRINNGSAFLFLDDDLVKNKEVINIFESGEDLLILTKNDGLYRYTDNTLIKANVLSNDILSNISIYDAIKLKNNNFAIGTISEGLFILNEKWEIISQVNRKNGLINNTVLALTEDSSNNIWLGLDNGISYVETNSPYAIINEQNGIFGSVYASAIHNEKLYLGTNQGLFYRKLESKDDFNFIKGTEGQVWCLKIIDDTLLCGHNSGTFFIDEGQAKKISDIQGTWKIARIDNNTDLLLQGNYDGLYVLERSKDGWKLRNKLKGFNNSSRYFETLDKQIFVNHEYKGIFRLEVISDYSSIKKVTLDSSLKGYNSGIAKYKGELLYAYNEGIFKYDVENQLFRKEDQLSKAYTESEYDSGKMIVNEKDHSIWVFTKSNIVNISPTGLTNKERFKYIPLTSEVRRGILGYENISSLGDDKYLLGSTSGYVIIDQKQTLNEDFQIHIGQVINGGNNSILQPQKMNVPGDFRNKQNNLEITFYTAEFNKYLNTRYQYQLLGLYDNWSAWSENPVASFENLPYGKYIFNVRSKIGDTISKNISTYEFEIAKPWHISNLMIILYTAGLLIFLLVMHNLYKQYYKNQSQRVIAKNQKEQLLEQVQNEREIIKLRNEKLRIDYTSKSKELAASLLSIGKKNDLLRNIRDDLNEQRADYTLKSVINTINKSLKQEEGWDFFQEAFNNVDSEFLKIIKVKHPNLTPSDLKLCGYLRLNLSTKEMSELLNITPRSVEIKRYRLRKKLNLEHEDNLVNYILGL